MRPTRPPAPARPPRADPPRRRRHAQGSVPVLTPVWSLLPTSAWIAAGSASPSARVDEDGVPPVVRAPR
eukprot:11170798-Lingulodinium_polyedra.AAC.1